MGGVLHFTRFNHYDDSQNHSMTHHLKIISLNTWCPPQGQHREMRVLAIAEKIKQLAPDVVCLQEMFLSGSRNLMIEQLRSVYPHYQYFSSGLLGSGLLTLSKHPIIDCYFHPFRLKGKPEKITHGDYYVAKGVGLTRIQFFDTPVDIYNTHTHAQYEMAHDNEYAVFNHTNLHEVSRFIANQSASNPVVLCGDLNTRPDQLGYRLITHFTQLTDVYHHLYPNDCDGFTYHQDNPYVKEANQRLDYVMVKNGVTPLSIAIEFTRLLSATSALAYSDHYGLLAEVAIAPFEPAPSPHNTKKILQELLTELEREQGLANAQQIHHSEQAIFSTLALADTQITGRFLAKHFPRLARFISTLILLSAGIYGGYHALNTLYNLRVRKNVLAQITTEIRHQMNAFNTK
jgi:endonuclease/exonuclease/phosphatase family metal-dependent hydrolase